MVFENRPFQLLLPLLSAVYATGGFHGLKALLKQHMVGLILPSFTLKVAIFPFPEPCQ
jgi:hypothetical protein